MSAFLAEAPALSIEQGPHHLRRLPGDAQATGVGEVHQVLGAVIDTLEGRRGIAQFRVGAHVHEGVTRIVRDGLRFDNYLVASSCHACMDPVVTSA